MFRARKGFALTGRRLHLYGINLSADEEISPRTEKFFSSHGLSIKNEYGQLSLKCKPGNEEASFRFSEAEEFAEKRSNVAPVYANLLNITAHYLRKSNLDADKQKIFQRLNECLDLCGQTKYQAVVKFADELKGVDQNLLSKHRTAEWKRFLYNVVSILMVIPALARSLYGYSQYGSFAFWAPDSKKALDGAQATLKTFKP
ncbi:MAG TPA: hypothetical protein VHA13_02910 [Gammaproteobacteria bacterium]|nr:hypothetical protein [Gammaproteobacteria bacterium]